MGAHIEISIGDIVTGEGAIGATVPLLFVNEGIGVGREFGTRLLAIDAGAVAPTGRAFCSGGDMRRTSETAANKY